MDNLDLTSVSNVGIWGGLKFCAENGCREGCYLLTETTDRIQCRKNLMHEAASRILKYSVDVSFLNQLNKDADDELASLRQENMELAELKQVHHACVEGNLKLAAELDRVTKERDALIQKTLPVSRMRWTAEQNSEASGSGVAYATRTEVMRMERLIGADKFKRALCKAKCGECEKLCVGAPDSCFQQWRMDMLTLQIDQAPTVDAEPVRHGRWVDKCVRDWHCSECDYEVAKVRRVDGYCYKDKPNYCPHCGAKMGGGTAHD